MDNLHAIEVAPALTDEEIDALTTVEDEESASLDAMSPRMIDALTRHRQASA